MAWTHKSVVVRVYVTFLHTVWRLPRLSQRRLILDLHSIQAAINMDAAGSVGLPPCAYFGDESWGLQYSADTIPRVRSA